MAAKSIVSWQNFRHLFIGTTDYGATVSSLNFMREAKVLEAKVLHGAAVERDAGTLSDKIEIDCYAPVLTAAMKASLGTKVDVLFPASTGQPGGLCIFGVAVQSDVQVMAPVGEYHALKITVPMDGPGYLGHVLLNSVMDANMVANPLTAPAAGPWYALGTVSGAQRVVTAVFLTAFTGTLINFVVQVDEAAHASPATLVTHTFSAVGTSMQINAGPVSPETDYRVNVTGTFSSAAALVVVAKA